MDQVLLSINNTRTRLMRAAADHATLEELYVGRTAELTAEALAAAYAAGADCGGLVLSSVAPPAEERIAGWLREFRVTRVSPQLRLNFSLEQYPGRTTLGADRIACMAAVADKHALPAVILDLGTAVTVDVLDAGRVYLGGIIAPGLRLYTEYLPERTALLPPLPAGQFPSPEGLGQGTQGAMLAGVHYGFRGMLQGLLTAAQGRLARAPHSIIVTGGDAAVLENALGTLPGPVVHAPLLAFEGMRLLGQLNPPAIA